MRKFGEYTKTQYKRLNGIQWKITEKKIANVRQPQRNGDYFLVRTYDKKIGGVWIYKHGVNFNCNSHTPQKEG